MSKFIDLTGNRYDMLYVVRRVENSDDGCAQYLCKCDCGNEKIVKSNNLRNGLTHSCGCLKKKVSAENHFVHGATGGRNGKPERLYTIWRGIIGRCCFPSATEYEYYGGRGITVCEDWRNDYLAFRDWALENGYDKNLTIDRINNDGNYEPSNCRWVTMKFQMNNKRNNHILEYAGQSKTLTEWAEQLGMPVRTLSDRINRRHWPIDKALSCPVTKRNRLPIDN